MNIELIAPNEYIGDSLVKINENFTSLSAAITELASSAAPIFLPQEFYCYKTSVDGVELSIKSYFEDVIEFQGYINYPITVTVGLSSGTEDEYNVNVVNHLGYGFNTKMGALEERGFQLSIVHPDEDWIIGAQYVTNSVTISFAGISGIS